MDNIENYGMKNPKYYCIVLGTSVCVGVATFYYFYRRRSKEDEPQCIQEPTIKAVESTKLETAPAVGVTPSNSKLTSTSDSMVKVFLDADTQDEITEDILKEDTSCGSTSAFAIPPLPVTTNNLVTEPRPAVLGDNNLDVSPMQVRDTVLEFSLFTIADTLMRLSKPGSLAQLNMEDAKVLTYTLSFVHGKELARILETIAQAACFNVNLPILSASECFSRTQALLRKASKDRRFCPESVKISLLHALTNLSASDEHQQALKTSVDDLFSLSEGQEESLVGVACLCVIANLSLTKYCHSEIATYSSRLFELLEDEDTGLLKQVLTILLNLCCERSTVPMLLTAKAPTEMATFVAQTGTIGTNTDLLIKWLRILRNLYKVIREDCITCENLGLTSKSIDGTVFKELQKQRLHMKACVFLLCHNKESHGLAAGAKMLYEYLEVF